jgi:hypothetical protein
MTKQIQDLAAQAKESVPKGILSVEDWVTQYNVLFAELLIKECVECCGSQADRKTIRKRFGLPVESNVKYEGPEPHGSITSQYERQYNLPKEK